MEPVVGCSMPVARFKRVVLPAPLGPTEADDVPGGDAQRAVLQRPPAPVLLAQTAGFNCGSHIACSSWIADLTACWKIASMLSESSPAARALRSHGSRSSLSF